MTSGAHRTPFVVLLCLLVAPALGLAQVPEYQLKAEFIERFTRFIDWPDAPADDPHAPFVIGLFGGNPFGNYLAGTMKGRPVKVHEISDPSEAASVHVLFICASGRRSVKRILAETATRPVLTIGDSQGLAEQGVLINFYSVEDKIAFEINDAAARRSGLKVSSRLLKLARIVNLEATP
jgi:hypothetical protein